jgi:CBS domain-containing protein
MAEEENVFFLPVKDFCQRQVVTCSPDEPLVEVARTMRERNISSVVVCEDGEPAGIVTDRDLRNKVIARGEDPRPLTVRTVMNSPLQVVGEEEHLFEALHRMFRLGIHRVGVVDAAGGLTGIITDSDIIRLQTRSPQQMLRDIEEAATPEDLKIIHSRVQSLVVHLTGTGVPTTELVRMIAHLNDRILLRLILLLRAQRFSDLTERFAFIVLGSEGRREQTLTTDQDNAIVYADDLPEPDVQKIAAFSRELIDALVAVGVPPCPGGIMASNDTWRRSLSGWMEILDRWFSSSTPEHILNGSMFFDLRTIYGDPSLERSLKKEIIERLQRDAIFLLRMAENVLRFRPPLGWFGRIKVERKGEYRGLLDVKKAGIFAITEGVKVLALEAGVMGGGTRERIRMLAEKKVFTPEEADDLEASFNFLGILRLRGQVAAIKEGRGPNNHVDLDHINRMEKGRLRLALEGVETFQGFLKRHFHLDTI